MTFFFFSPEVTLAFFQDELLTSFSKKAFLKEFLVALCGLMV
jgi:hypothetical protein